VAAIIFIHSNMGGLLLFAWSMLLQLTMRKGQYLLPFLSREPVGSFARQIAKDNGTIALRPITPILEKARPKK